MSYCLICNKVISFGATRCRPHANAHIAMGFDSDIPKQNREPETRANARVSTSRPSCRTPDACIAKTPGRHCSPCSLAAKWKDPAFREKRRAGFAAKMADPAFRTSHVAASQKRLREWRETDEGKAFFVTHGRETCGHLNTPEGLEDRAYKTRKRRLAGIPEHRWEEYRGLARQMPSAEARRIILDDDAKRESDRLAAMSPFERQLERVRNGAALSEKPSFRPVGHDYTLGGVASGML